MPNKINYSRFLGLVKGKTFDSRSAARKGVEGAITDLLTKKETVTKFVPRGLLVKKRVPARFVRTRFPLLSKTQIADKFIEKGVARNRKQGVELANQLIEQALFFPKRPKGIPKRKGPYWTYDGFVMEKRTGAKGTKKYRLRPLYLDHSIVKKSGRQ